MGLPTQRTCNLPHVRYIVSTFCSISSMTALIIWFAGVSFVLFQFFIQLSSGVIIDSIMHEMALSALATGILSSSFYYVYTSLQIPVGILFDIKSTRFLMTMGTIVCSIGCFLFAHSYTFSSLMAGRLLLGSGAAFAFIGLSHLIRTHFTSQQFAFMIGLSETLGFIITMLGMISLGVVLQHWGWRNFITYASVTGLFIAYACWRTIPEMAIHTRSSGLRIKQLGTILKSGKLWVNGIIVGLSFTVITVFGAMWAIPFIQIKLLCSLKAASMVDSMLFLGAAVSCPLFGYLAGIIPKRRLLMNISCLLTAALLLIVLFVPVKNLVLMGFLMFLIGACCGAYMLGYSIANELAPANALSTCTGFTNTLAMLTAPLMQPLVGYILDGLNQGRGPHQLNEYQWSLIIIPVGLMIASGLVFLLPEKR